MKVNDLFEMFYCQVEHMKIQSKYIQNDVELRNRQFEAYGICSAYHNLLECCEDYKTYTMRRATRRERKQFAYRVEGEYTSFEVSLNNNIYRQINPQLEEIHEGQHYKDMITPDCIMELGGRKFPIFDDDPGQCWYMRLPNGKEISTSSFCLCPETEFMGSLFDAIMLEESGLYSNN